MARRTGPAKRTVEFARALGEHPMLVAAVHKVLMDTLPLIAAQLEAAERQATAPPVSAEVPSVTVTRRSAITAEQPPPLPTYHERMASRATTTGAATAPCTGSDRAAPHHRAGSGSPDPGERSSTRRQATWPTPQRA